MSHASLRLILLFFCGLAFPMFAGAQTVNNSPISTASETTKPIHLKTIVVTAKAPTPATTTRQQTDLSLGTSSYTLTQGQINQIAQGENTSFNQVLVRTPGVSDDTYGAIHFRNEDPYYRYYINGTLLPSGINGFSQDIDTRFVESV